MSVRRIFVEKKQGFDVESQSLCSDIRTQLNISQLDSVRILVRYDAQGLDEAQWNESVVSVFSEPMVDAVYTDMPKADRVLVREYLPGQYDQRADSASQCIQLLTAQERPLVRTASVFCFTGNINDNQFLAIKNYLINPVESREGSLEIPNSLELPIEKPDYPEILNDFTSYTREQMQEFHSDMGLAMTIEDALFVASYFKSENRSPSITELRIIDTYWSDHCRHTTFGTELDTITIDSEAPYVQDALNTYRKAREEFYGNRINEKPECLMDIATLGGKSLYKDGKIPDLDVSEEINACSIKVAADIDGKKEDWLVMFKNETHNHPTEIEPFGGAATCLGGAIRDPLSGRSYVYQSMRVTGSADPRKPMSETLPGKLPQRVITKGAAAGFASYGNQIGLATGQVTELYHEGWAAKRMEIGAVVGAAPAKNVIRKVPQNGNVVILIGGRTGRDGCGGATGSSKAHTAESLDTCGAEVQKGNALTERKIQRLFRNPDVSQKILRCNDFGAGGVCVAVGELADSLDINLDAVPLKYEGLSGTELAISESQERMAIVIDAKDVDFIIEAAAAENLEATLIAEITDSGRMRMMWKGKTIADLSREFLNTNGVTAHAKAHITSPKGNFFTEHASRVSEIQDIEEQFKKSVGDLQALSQRGLGERFDASIGAGTVLMPFSGKNQSTPVQAMAAKLPLIKGETTTATVMAHGYDPNLSSWSPYHGSVYAICESILRTVCAGSDASKVRLTFQEYFPRLKDDPKRWGMPLAALLGAFDAQLQLGLPAIGGKDSMSGTFESIDVPPALVSFALATQNATHLISGEFKQSGNRIVYIKTPQDSDSLPIYADFLKICSVITSGIENRQILSAYTCAEGGIARSIAYMAFGNSIGAKLNLNKEELFAYEPCSVLLELSADADEKELFANLDEQIIGTTGGDAIEVCGTNLALKTLFDIHEGGLEKIFPVKAGEKPQTIQSEPYNKRNTTKPKIRVAKPRVLIPVFPGTNCEYDTARAFEKAGAIPEVLIVRNTKPNDIEETVATLQKAAANAQIIAIPGGFSGGDEPDGSGKFIATVFRSPRLAQEVSKLLEERDGLMIGICNGFQALIKLGLVPYGKITPMKEDAPTLTFNAIGRHQSRIVRTKVVSTLSPWFAGVSTDDVISVPISHGEGRFVCSAEEYATLLKNGQIASQYVDIDGNLAWQNADNPAGSYQAVEGITSVDGRVLGKMGHNERCTPYTFKNVSGNYDSKIFESGVKYFL